MQWFALLGYALPELLALGIALALLLTHARKGRAQRLGLIGIGVMALAAVAEIGLGVFQQLWLSRPDVLAGNQVAQYVSTFVAIRIAIRIVSLGGLLGVVWALCRATHETASPQ